MESVAWIFYEYDGNKIPPQFTINRQREPVKSTSENEKKILKTNIKFFEIEPQKRENIMGIMRENGQFRLVADKVVVTRKDKTPDKITGLCNIHKYTFYDRLIYESINDYQ